MSRRRLLKKALSATSLIAANLCDFFICVSERPKRLKREKYYHRNFGMLRMRAKTDILSIFFKTLIKLKWPMEYCVITQVIYV